jgi:hypothetical protein
LGSFSDHLVSLRFFHAAAAFIKETPAAFGPAFGGGHKFQAQGQGGDP